MQRTDTLLVGATAYAVGYASANQKCMIVEEGQWPCSDFSASLNAEPIDDRGTYTPQTQSLLNVLKTRGLIDSCGRVHILPIAARFSEELLRSGARVWFDATLVCVEEQKNGYAATVFHRNGFERIQAKRIIDTRACACLDGARKFICAVISPVAGNLETPNARLLTGALGETILKLYLDSDADYLSARRKTEEWIRKHLNGAKIYSFANTFGYEYAAVCEKGNEKAYRLIPSFSFRNVLSAYENGVKAGAADESII